MGRVGSEGGGSHIVTVLMYKHFNFSFFKKTIIIFKRIDPGV